MRPRAVGRAGWLLLATLLACTAVHVASGAGSGPEHRSPLLSLLQQTGAVAADAPPGERFELDARTIAAVCVAFFIASLAASAGVGGGAFFVPLFMLLGFGLKDATVLSQCTITAVSAASILFNAPKRHPTNPADPLISYDQLLTMTPALLVGVGVGVILNAAFPTWLITTMLVCLLTYMSARTVQKGMQQWRGETASKREAAAAAAAAAGRPAQGQAGSPGGGDGGGGDGGGGSGGTASPGAVVVISDAGAPELGPSKPRRAGYPWGKALGVVFLWCSFAALQLLRQQTARCSPAFFAVIGAQVAFGAGCSALFAWYCLCKPAREAEGAEGLAAPLLAGSSSQASLTGLLARMRHHQQASMLALMANALKVAIAGAVAGVVGVGGGLIMAPMLLSAGIHPQSTSATSNVLVCMSSSSAALAFALEGRVNASYAAVFCGVCGAASLIGLTGVGRLVKASGRPSIVVLLLAFIMGAGGICSAAFGYLDAWRHGEAGFKSIC